MWVMKIDGVRQISTKDEDRVALKRSSQIGKNFLQEDYNWMNNYLLNFQLNYDTTFNGLHCVWYRWKIRCRAHSSRRS